jgi:hypothetical protein
MNPFHARQNNIEAPLLRVCESIYILLSGQGSRKGNYCNRVNGCDNGIGALLSRK